jgi:hypothetical protein
MCNYLKNVVLKLFLNKELRARGLGNVGKNLMHVGFLKSLGQVP